MNRHTILCLRDTAIVCVIVLAICFILNILYP